MQQKRILPQNPSFCGIDNGYYTYFNYTQLNLYINEHRIIIIYHCYCNVSVYETSALMQIWNKVLHD